MQTLLAIAALTVALIAGDMPTGRAQAETPVPSVVEPCVDRSSFFVAGGAALIATETVESTDYYLIYTYEDAPGSDQYPIALLVSSSAQNSCEVELWNTPRDALAYADYVPFRAAVKFQEIEYKIQLMQLGREKFINAFGLSETNLFPEEEAALEHLDLLKEIRSNQ
jgi:hypothetical protein